MHDFLVTFLGPGEPSPDDMETVHLSDIIDLDDAKRNCVNSGDYVLAPRGQSERCAYEPAVVKSGFERREGRSECLWKLGNELTRRVGSRLSAGFEPRTWRSQTSCLLQVLLPIRQLPLSSPTPRKLRYRPASSCGCPKAFICAASEKWRAQPLSEAKCAG